MGKISMERLMNKQIVSSPINTTIKKIYLTYCNYSLYALLMEKIKSIHKLYPDHHLLQ